jgi:hypothetical protein
VNEFSPSHARADPDVDVPRSALRLSSVVALALLGVVTLVGLLLRIAQVNESLWLDELHTAWTVSGGVADIPPRAAMGNYSPVFFLLPWAAIHTLGTSELALRLPSLVPGVLLIPLAYIAVLRWTGSRAAGLLAAWVVALDAHFMFYAQEARPYALIQLLGLVHILLFWSVLSAPTWGRRAALVIIAALLFYLHYTSLLIVVAEAVAYVWVFAFGKNRIAYRPMQILADVALICLACLPASGHLLEIAARRHNWKAFVSPQPVTVLATFYPFPIMLYVLLPAAVAVLVAVFRRMLQIVPSMGEADWRLMSVLLCWYLVPAALAWLTTSTGFAPLFYRRYLMFASLAPVMIAGIVCAWGASPWIRVGIAAWVAAVILVVDWGGYHVGPLSVYRFHGKFTARSTEDWRGAVRYLNSVDNDSRQPVFVQSGLIEAAGLGGGDDAALADYLLLPVTTTIYPLDHRRRRIWPLRNSPPLIADPDAVATAFERGGAWIVVRGEDAWPQRTLQHLIAVLGDRQWKVERTHERSFKGVTIYHLKITRR